MVSVGDYYPPPLKHLRFKAYCLVKVHAIGDLMDTIGAGKAYPKDFNTVSADGGPHQQYRRQQAGAFRSYGAIQSGAIQASEPQ